MGSRVEYQFKFLRLSSEEKDQEMVSEPSLKAGFVFEIRTDFILKTRLQTELEGVTAAEVFVGSESFDVDTNANKDNKPDVWMLAEETSDRLSEYGMDAHGFIGFLHEAVNYAGQKAAQPENSSHRIITIICQFWVYTVQQENESFEEAMNRASVARDSYCFAYY